MYVSKLWTHFTSSGHFSELTGKYLPETGELTRMFQIDGDIAHQNIAAIFNRPEKHPVTSTNAPAG